jgi:hypothetical protein
MAYRIEVNGSGLLIPGVNGAKKHGLIVSDRNVSVPRFEVASALTAEALSLPIRRLHPRFNAYEVDVHKLLDFHPNWYEEVKEVAATAPIFTIKGGSVETSMVPLGFDTIYQPTRAKGINDNLPWLAEYFRGPFQLLVQRATGDPTLQLGEGNATLNINYFKQEDFIGKQKIGYEMHVDRNPITAILFLTTLDDKEGGKLVLREGRDENNKAIGSSLSIRPEAGKLIIFDGNTHPHEVTVITSNQARMAVPGDYFSARIPEVHDLRHDQLLGVED